jgi:hypothetical protein
MGEMGNAYNILVGRSEWKRLLRTSNRRCEDNIRIDLREVRGEVVDLKHLNQNSDQWRYFVKTVMKLRIA